MPKYRHFRVSLSIEDVRRRLCKNIGRPGLFWIDGMGDLPLVGTVHGNDRFSIRVRRGLFTLSHPGIPFLFGRLKSIEEGCEIRTRVSWHPLPKGMLVVFIGIVIVCTALELMGIKAWAGAKKDTLDALAVCGSALLMLAIMCGISHLLGRGDKEQLQNFLPELFKTELLEVPLSGHTAQDATSRA